MYHYTTQAEELQAILDEKIDELEKRQKIKKSKIDEKLINAIEKESVKENVKNCATYLEFNQDGSIVAANFCKHRLCNICNWREAAKKWHRTKNTIDYIGNATYAHMVLTLRNCKTEELKQTISNIMQAINRMCSRPKWKQRVLGYIRALEITYNPEQKEGLKWHPHYHYILCLPEDYETNSDIYLSLYDWRKMWEDSAKIKYNTQFHFQIIKGSEISNAVAEVSKYAVKAAKIFETIGNDSGELKALLKAINGRRLYSLGGIIKEINAKANPEEYKTLEEKISDRNNSIAYVYAEKTGYIKLEELREIEQKKVYKQENVNQKKGAVKNEDKPP